MDLGYFANQLSVSFHSLMPKLCYFSLNDKLTAISHTKFLINERLIRILHLFLVTELCYLMTYLIDIIGIISWIKTLKRPASMCGSLFGLIINSDTILMSNYVT